MSRILQPEKVILRISQGDFLIVKKHLNAGERWRVFGKQVKSMIPGEKINLDPMAVGRTLASYYLVDWSLKGLPDKDGIEHVIPILGKDPSEIGEILESLDIDSFNEVRQAIEAHEEAMEKERDALKKSKAAESDSSKTSQSAA